MRTTAVIAGLWLCSLQVQAFPQDYFRSPIDSQIVLAGNFGEPRHNHFHTGIDIKTNGEEGWNIYAAADGYVSRISISSGGYGHVIYIAHPNGYITVYGHLKRFNETLQHFIRNKQYRSESFEQDIMIRPGLFKVEKGDLIAYSGNTGFSGGPHLHFEVRESETNRPVNPLLFGLEAQDNIAPVIHAIKVYALSDSHIKIYYTSGRHKTVTGGNDVLLSVSKRGGKYVLKGLKKIEAHGDIALAIMTTDLMNNAYNVLGPYKIELCMNGELVHSQKMRELDFTKKKFINAHIDHAEHIKRRRWFHRSHILPYNELDIYETGEKKGVISLGRGDQHKLTYYVYDINGNSSLLPFEIVGSEKLHIRSAEDKGDKGERIRYNKKHELKREDLKIEFQEYTFFEDVSLKYEQNGHKGFSNIHHAGSSEIAVFQPFRVYIRVPGLSERLQKTVGIVNSYGQYVQGQYDNGWISASHSILGSFHVEIDTVGPIIDPLNFQDGSNLSNTSTIQIKVTDKLSGVKYIRGEINGRWVLFQFDAKSSRIFHTFEQDLRQGKHTLQLFLKDTEDNVTTRSYTFYR